MNIFSLLKGSIESNNFDTTFILNVKQQNIINNFIQKVKQKKSITEGIKIADMRTFYDIMIDGERYQHYETGDYSLYKKLIQY